MAGARVCADTKALSVFLLGALLFGASASASADGLRPLPDECPAGTRVWGNHGMSGCRPELPSDCPDGYEPRVRLASATRSGAAGFVAYCEPPASVACPTGSREDSTGPNEPTCTAATRCDNDRICGSDYHCRPASFCMNPSSETGDQERNPRYPPDMRALSVCSADSDCDGRQVCVTTERCDADVHRVDSEGRTLEAVVVPLPVDWQPIILRAGIALTMALVVGGALYWRRRRGRV